MGYLRAEEILPIEVIELIQQYVDGENIDILRKESNRQAWGAGRRNWLISIFFRKRAYSVS